MVKSLNAQLSFEFLLVFGFVMMIIIPAVYFAYMKNTEVVDDVRLSKMQYSVSLLKSIFESVRITKGAVVAKITLPSYSSLKVSGSENFYLLMAEVETRNGVSQIVSIVPNATAIWIDNSRSNKDVHVLVKVEYLNETNLNVTLINK